MINYPGARLIPNTKFENGDPDIDFFDNARGQWKPKRAWFGVLVENVVSGTARDLLAAALLRFKARGLPVVFHCHDEIVIEVPEDANLEQEALALLLERPAWAGGLTVGGQVHSGPLYVETVGESPAVETPPQPVDWSAALERDFPRASNGGAEAVAAPTEPPPAPQEIETYIRRRMAEE